MWDPEHVKDAEGRFGRFQKLFRLQAELWQLVNRLLDEEPVRLRDGADRDVSLLVGASLGKALKTFESVHELCLRGSGEDALILLRSNVNLLINLGYILADPQPAERTADFIAFSHQARVKYLNEAHGVERPPWRLREDDATVRMRAERWEKVRIKKRAERVPGFHYTTGYAFYSSIEHSDAMALNGYIAEWDEVGPRIHAAPSDDYVPVALGHNAMVLADILTLYCRHFQIRSPDSAEAMKNLIQSIGS